MWSDGMPLRPQAAITTLSAEAVPLYLARLGHARPLSPTAETLRALHKVHMYAVPFENLDIGLGRRLSLSRPALFDKIVTRRRGGFCYELNGLFAWLLERLGFSVTYLSARIVNSAGQEGPEFDHLTLAVACPADGRPAERWLADVGCGDSFVEPLRLVPGVEQAGGGRVYWLAARGENLDSWQREAGAEPERLYAFTLQPRQFPSDYGPMCLYLQTAPESHFTQHRVCTLATPGGRLTLSDRRWIVTEHGTRRETEIDDAEFERRLRADFGLAPGG
jgi:N-hydroxyarylamine O-acetyltransferase